ncbi:flagellar hook protein FlgE [Hyphomicrobium sp.]|uniref:flagellar hook protein FlgE n=1 Tax=Hyphomicrobium sp. TaxID=82 RepID=UPI0025BC2B04|nr:flagellar hook protein FlgE [Hyphomicrobium sp.]MCC7253307.1 flagellar hook protein FlgE [Hyphomicrobium sp.]
MSISGMMRTSASGMAAQSSRLGTVSDNIANASTHGYKRAFTAFSTVVLESGSGSYVPGSVDTTIRYGISEQGGFDYTTSATDLAVSGQGFFLVSDGSDSTYLTRAGSFVKDDQGYLVNAAGFKLLGYPIVNGSAAASSNGTAGLAEVNIATMSLEATPSTIGTFHANVPVSASAVASGNRPSDNIATSAYTAKTSITAIDNVGREITLDVYYTKTGTNTWQVDVFNAADAASSTSPFPYGTAGSSPLSSTTLTFDAGTGQISSVAPTNPAGLVISIPVPNGQALTLDVSKSSELAESFQVLMPTINGNKPSSVEGVEFASDGMLYAVYGNGARVGIYQIPLATVPSPDNLTPEAGNVYSISATSGNLQVGFPGTTMFGTIRSSALEKSTVDTATELTTMIESQFAFTANSKVFQTGGELMEVLVNLKR